MPKLTIVIDPDNGQTWPNNVEADMAQKAAKAGGHWVVGNPDFVLGARLAVARNELDPSEVTIIAGGAKYELSDNGAIIFTGPWPDALSGYATEFTRHVVIEGLAKRNSQYQTWPAS
jgi:hypothetical protein